MYFTDDGYKAAEVWPKASLERREILRSNTRRG